MKTFFCIRSDTRQIFDAFTNLPDEKYLSSYSKLYGCEIAVIEGTIVKTYPEDKPKENENASTS